MQGTPETSSSHQDTQFADPNDWATQWRSQSAGSSKRRWIGLAVAATVLAVFGVGAMAFANVIGGGGPQPEDVLPANAIAFAKLDLNPSAGQKLAVYQLASKFPQAKSKVSSQDTSIKELTFGAIFTGKTGMGLNYKTDVEPWLGDRVGLGVFPDMDADEKPEIGLAVAFGDQGAAKTAMDKAVAQASKKRHKVGYAFAEGFLVVSDTNAHAAAMVQEGKVHPLVGSHYADDLKKIGTQQVGVAWLDIAPAIKALSKFLKSEMPKGLAQPFKTPAFQKGSDSKATGRVIEGLHAESSFVELVAMGVDIKGADAVAGDAGADAGLIDSFPSDVMAAFTANGLGKSIGGFYTSLSAQPDPLGVRSMLSHVGINSARQVETLLGQETGVMVAGSGARPQFAIRTRGSNPDAALAVARKALAGVPAARGLQIRKIAGPPGIVVGTRSTNPGFDLNKAIFSVSGSKLGGTEAFRTVIPQNDKVVFAGYVNLSKVLPALAKSSKAKPGFDAASLKPLSALGVTASGGSEPVLRIRLSVK
jgi:hypothetical protein